MTTKFNLFCFCSVPWLSLWSSQQERPTIRRGPKRIRNRFSLEYLCAIFNEDPTSQAASPRLVLPSILILPAHVEAGGAHLHLVLRARLKRLIIPDLLVDVLRRSAVRPTYRDRKESEDSRPDGRPARSRHSSASPSGPFYFMLILFYREVLALVPAPWQEVLEHGRRDAPSHSSRSCSSVAWVIATLTMQSRLLGRYFYGVEPRAHHAKVTDQSPRSARDGTKSFTRGWGGECREMKRYVPFFFLHTPA